MKNLSHGDYKKIIVFSIILAFYASFLVVKIQPTHMDNDAGLYISDGKIIWETKNVFKRNIYSYVETDYPFVNARWLSSVTFYFVTAVFGFSGLTIFKTLILLSAFTILFLAVMKKADFWLVAAFSLPTILILAGRNRIRPEMFSYLFIAIFLYLLFDLEKHPERKRIFWLSPLQLLWVNFHIYFFIGIALVAGFLFEKIVLHIPKKFWKTNWRNLINNPMVKKLLLILLILIAVSFINPNGIDGAMAPLQSRSYETFVVSENQPLFNFKASFLSWGIFNSIFSFGSMALIFLLSFIPAFFLRKSNWPIFLLLAGIAAAGAALIHVRLLSLFAIIFLPAVASNFNSIFIKTKDWLKKKKPKLALILGYSLIFIIAAVFSYQAYQMNARAAERGYRAAWGIGLDRYSSGAGEFFKEQNIKGPIFNDYDIGGYILYYLFPGEKVFVDNNGADSYPESFFNDIFMPTLQWDEKWQESQEKYGINSIFISIRDGSPAVGSFLWNRLHDSSWALVYIDTYAIILVKNIYENKEVIDKFSTPEHINGQVNRMLNSDDVMDRIVAGRFLYLFGRDDLSTSILKKVAAEYPKNSWVWLYMGSVKVMKNDPQSLISAVIFLENAVNMGEKNSEGYTWLGLAYFKTAQFKKAEEAFQKALWLDPGRYDATNYLNQLQQYLVPPAQ